MTEPSRESTAIDAVAESWVDTVAELVPTVATFIGRNEHNDRLGDHGPEGHDELARQAEVTRRSLSGHEPVDPVDAVTQMDLTRELDLMLELHSAGAHLRDLNVIASPVQDIRAVFDLMPTDSVDDWAVISRRLHAVPAAIDGYIRTLAQGISAGVVPARRQVTEAIVQIARYTSNTGFFAEFVRTGGPGHGQLPASLARDLSDGANAARVSYDRLASFLRTELAPVASEKDAVGRDLYALRSRQFLGAKVDLDETYQWGIEELARMVAEQEQIADQILPGASVAEAISHLEQDGSRRLHGTEALREWMQQTSDRAVAELGRSHFEIAEPIRALECRIAPTAEGGIYYTGPTDDFSRPGRMWWSVPEGVTEFDTWRELTTVYHEGVPGHHLQIAQAVYNRRQLNSWRRLLAGTSGHAEGWALYAERLMQELGYLDDPANRLGMLFAQRLRAARVVVDIGVHLGKPRLDGDGIWDADEAFRFIRANATESDPVVNFEVNRYLGWPGQAPSYKVGQRLWEQLRDHVRADEGANFDIRRFHKRALDIGGVGLDTLRAALIG